eukprot:4813850-Lingulodinium_polyedra.AAC.1
MAGVITRPRPGGGRPVTDGLGLMIMGRQRQLARSPHPAAGGYKFGGIIKGPRHAAQTVAPENFATRPPAGRTERSRS